MKQGLIEPIFKNLSVVSQTRWVPLVFIKANKFYHKSVKFNTIIFIIHKI